MGAFSFRRIVAILATIALLLSGAALAAGGEACAQVAAAAAMASHHGMAAGDHEGMSCDQDSKAPDHPMGTACVIGCFAKCPAPMPHLGTPVMAWVASQVVLPVAPDAGLSGIPTAPLLEPPKV